MRSCKFSLDCIEEFISKVNDLRNEIYDHSKGVEDFHSQLENYLEHKINQAREVISKLRYQWTQLDNELSSAYKRRQALINEGQAKGNSEVGIAYRNMLAPQIDSLTYRINSLEASISKLRQQIDRLEYFVSQVESIGRSINNSVRYLNSEYHQTISKLNYLESHAKAAYNAALDFCELGGGSSSGSIHEIHNIDLFTDQATEFVEIKDRLKNHRSDNKDGLANYQKDLSDNISNQIGEQLQDIYENYGQFLNNLDTIKNQMEDLYKALIRYYMSSEF